MKSSLFRATSDIGGQNLVFWSNKVSKCCLFVLCIFPALFWKRSTTNDNALTDTALYIFSLRFLSEKRILVFPYNLSIPGGEKWLVISRYFPPPPFCHQRSLEIWTLSYLLSGNGYSYSLGKVSLLPWQKGDSLAFHWPSYLLMTPR